jgi:hypothetical protein
VTTATDVSSTDTGIQPGAVFLLLLAVVFGLVAGYGLFGESRDYANYQGVYTSLSLHDHFSNYRFERGYMALSWLAKFYLGLDFAQYYAALVAGSLLLKFRLLWKHTSAPIIAALVYLMILFPFYEYTQLRAAVAFAFAYTAIDAYLDGKWFAALLWLGLGTLMHITAIVVGGGAVLVMLIFRWAPVLAVAFFSVVAVSMSLVVSASVRFLQNVNPLAAKYIETAFLNKTPNLFSVENILIFLLIVSSAFLLRPWQMRKNGFFYYLSFWTLIMCAALIKFPVFAHRLEDAFIFSCLLFAFRFDDSHQSRIPALIMILAGGWMAYRSVFEEWLLIYHR